MAGAITIRQATEADGAALLKLAALDEAAVPAKPALLGFVDDELVAALPVDGGRAVADPFRHTSAVVALMRAYARHLRGSRQQVHFSTAHGRLGELVQAA